MPSAGDLQPDRRIRILVLACGGLLQAAGTLVILWLPALRGGPEAVALLLWWWLAARDWSNQLHGYARVAAIRLDSSGTVECIDEGGKRYAMRLIAGSLVLRRLAWLRLEFPDRRRYAELLSGQCTGGEAWHWLQLVWQQQRSRIGRGD